MLISAHVPIFAFMASLDLPNSSVNIWLSDFNPKLSAPPRSAAGFLYMFMLSLLTFLYVFLSLVSLDISLLVLLRGDDF